MAAIGAVACTFVRGSVPPLKMRAETWQVAGLNGVGILLLGYSEGQGEVQAVFFSSAAGVEAWARSLAALQGSIVSVVTDTATHANCFVTAVGQVELRTAYMPGGVTTRGEVQVQLLRVA